MIDNVNVFLILIAITMHNFLSSKMDRHLCYVALLDLDMTCKARAIY
jgi:hypothetical protein